MQLQKYFKGFTRNLSILFLFSAAAAGAANSLDDTVTNSGSRSRPQLSYGVANILKLSQAKIGEETIVSYVQNSGLNYGGLGAEEIIYLHDEGVSSRVISTMLAEQKKLNNLVAQPSTQQNPIVPQAPAPPVATIVQPYAPPPVYAQPPQSPTVIVMRDSSPRLVDYGIYPFYRNSFYQTCGFRGYGYSGSGYSYPSASFSIGFGGGHFAAGYRSGHHRGGYYGGCGR
ncbi:MAG: hypothetical protein ABI042_06825 [Verrucomicrobiota bacterium]